jgi:hypothetical protein
MLKMHEIEKYKYKQWVTVHPHAYTHPARKAKPVRSEGIDAKCNDSLLNKEVGITDQCSRMFDSKNNRNIAKNISKTMLYDADDVDDFCWRSRGPRPEN